MLLYKYQQAQENSHGNWPTLLLFFYIATASYHDLSLTLPHPHICGGVQSRPTEYSTKAPSLLRLKIVKNGGVYNR